MDTNPFCKPIAPPLYCCIRLQKHNQLVIFLRLAFGGSLASSLSFAEDLSDSAGMTFAFFLTKTPLRVFLMSFFAPTEGLGFASALDAVTVMDAAAEFAAEVLAATAL